MNVKTLLDLCKKFQEEHITVWFDGGWGVDALMGFQTRHHDDLDLVVEEGSLEKLVQLLRKIGYDDVPRDDTRAWNFVLGDENGSLVDIHVININANGDGIYGPPENGEAYPAKALTGKGVINGEEVKCLTPEYQVLNHIGYELKEKDHKDVKNLCDKFNIALPITLETPHRENDT